MKIWRYKKELLGGYVAYEYQEMPSTDEEALKMWEEFDGGKMTSRETVSAEYWCDLIQKIREDDSWDLVGPRVRARIAAPLCVADPLKLQLRSESNTTREAPPGLIRWVHFGY